MVEEAPVEFRAPEGLSAPELRDAWPLLAPQDRVEGFKLLPREDAEEFFLGLRVEDQFSLLHGLAQAERTLWMRLLPPDDAVDLVQVANQEERQNLLGLLDEVTRKEVMALQAYEEDAAGGLMSPRYARVRPEMKVDEAISYLRKQAQQRIETLSYAYVLDAEQHLLGVVSIRELFSAPAQKRVHEVMQTNMITVPEHMDQEQVSRVFAQHGLLAIPVIDADRRMKGIVTVDDIVDVVQEEATEDIHKLGGMAVLEEPYLEAPFKRMIRKRAGWLCVLFLGEMLTATAMGYFEDEISRAVVLALFIPLIISSGGNSGSQASTLVIRAMALGEVRLRDWWRVVRREIIAGLVLGCILGTIGIVRILVWPARERLYGQHYIMVSLTVGISLLGVVMFGTLAGSLLPFILKRLGLDPASASAPFVATLVDVTGLVIYFFVANVMLHGLLL